MADTRTGEPWTDGAAPDPALADAVSIDTVRAAAARIAGHATRTPVLTSPVLDASCGASVRLKCENLQPIGAFKIRGATNAIACLSEERRRDGVLAYSSGNHAQGVAYACAALGVRGVIVMPSDAPRVKLASTRRLLEHAPDGSRVETYDPAEISREEVAARLLEREPMTLIPPYDHPDVISGQGTAALELFEEAPDLERLYVCCGGGGLLSGCATVARALAPGCEVVGVEPEAADDANRSFRDRVLRTVRNPDTIADGARTPYLGRYTFPIVLERVDRMTTVSDAELARWTLFCLERLRLVVEPSGALALAAAARDRAPGRVGVMLTGGNLDLDTIGRLRALAGDTTDA
ncbi:MAG: pyridoxal-phosphate dependent enzyme [Phycisphaerales bacterium JB040]